MTANTFEASAAYTHHKLVKCLMFLLPTGVHLIGLNATSRMAENTELIATKTSEACVAHALRKFVNSLMFLHHAIVNNPPN
eukprot:7616425-Pyramimonas_sp.AAC.1